MAPGKTSSLCSYSSRREADLDESETFATLTLTKVSICLFLLRITVTKTFIRPLQAAILILVLSNIILSLLWIVQCTPHLDKVWNNKLLGQCFTKDQLERIIITQARKWIATTSTIKTYISQLYQLSLTSSPPPFPSLFCAKFKSIYATKSACVLWA